MAQSVNIPVEINVKLNQQQLDSVTKKITSSINSIQGFKTKDFFAPITKSSKSVVSGLTKINGSVNQLSSSFSTLRNIALSSISLVAISKLGSSMVKLSSDLIEVQNVVDTTFGSMSSDVDNFAKSAIRSFGLTELQAKRYTSVLGAMTKATGLTAEDSLKMSKNIAQLTGDVASFYNLDHDTAFEKLRSGISGETEPLKQLGVAMTVANLEAYSLSRGITTSYNAMSEAEKTALRYNFILNSLKDAQGDYNKTQNTWSNQLRLLGGQLAQLGGILGGFLQKVLYPILVATNQLISLAITGASALAKMFGFDMPSIQIQQSSPGANLAPDIGESGASEMDSLASSTENAATAQNKLNKEQKKSLSNLHELNVLNSKSSSSEGAGGSGGASSGAGGLGGLNLDLGDYDVAVSEIVNPFANIVEKIKTMILSNDWEGLGALFAGKINGVFTYVDFTTASTYLNTGLTNIISILNGFVSTLDTTGIGVSVGNFLNTIVSAANIWLTTVDFSMVGQRIAELINGSFATFDGVAFGTMIANYINSAISVASGLIATLDWEQIGTIISDSINGFFANLDTEKAAEMLNNFVDGIKTTLSTIIEETDWGEVWGKILDFFDNLDLDTKLVGLFLLAPKLVTFVSKIVGAFNGLKPVFGFISSIVGSVISVFNKLKDVFTLVTQKGFSFKDAFSTIFGSVGTMITGVTGVVVGIITTVSNFFSMLINGFNWLNEILMIIGIAITAVFSIILGAPAVVTSVIASIVAAVLTLFVIIKDNWNKIIDFLEKGIDIIVNFFSGLWTKITEIFGVVVDFFSDIFTKAYDGIVNAFSSVGEFFSGIWESITNVFSSVGDWFSEKFDNAVESIKSVFSGLDEFFQEVWDDIVEIFTDIGTNVSDAITGALKFAINGILSGAVAIINGFIDALNMTIGAINVIPGVDLDKLDRLEVPKLAKGAVIPPNNEFLAVLGDQKHGTNIETPLSTMIQAFKSALPDNGFGGSEEYVINVYVNNELSSTEIRRKQDLERYRSNGK